MPITLVAEATVDALVDQHNDACIGTEFCDEADCTQRGTDGFDGASMEIGQVAGRMSKSHLSRTTRLAL
jgi:hypothetical protein